jgi:hypothetical protein
MIFMWFGLPERNTLRPRWLLYCVALCVVFKLGLDLPEWALSEIGGCSVLLYHNVG